MWSFLTFVPLMSSSKEIGRLCNYYWKRDPFWQWIYDHYINLPSFWQLNCESIFVCVCSGDYSMIEITIEFFLHRFSDISKLTNQCLKCFEWRKKIVFYYQNCSDQLWEKIVLVIEKNFWNSRLKAENLQKFWDHLNDLFKQWKVRTIFADRMLF